MVISGVIIKPMPKAKVTCMATTIHTWDSASRVVIKNRPATSRMAPGIISGRGPRASKIRPTNGDDALQQTAGHHHETRH